ncbi:trigger factor, partial [Paenarthrobacter sp. RAF9]
GQVPMMVSEVRRRKALAVVLGQAEVTDSEGNKVDLSDFVRPGGEEASFEADATDEAAAAEAPAESTDDAAAAEAPKNDDPAAVKF